MSTVKIEGYASVFNRDYIGDDAGNRYRVLPKAFRAGSGQWQLWLRHERPDRVPLASVRAGTLSMFQDDFGLGFTATIDGEISDQLREEIASGRLTGMSIGQGINSTSRPAADGVREFGQLEVEEISVTYAPRNPAATCWLADCYEPALNDTQIEARRRFILRNQATKIATRQPANVAPAPHFMDSPAYAYLVENHERARRLMAGRMSAGGRIFNMALSAGDAASISNWLTRHAGTTSGGTDTSRVAGWIRSRWGGTAVDATTIAAYAEARGDTDLVRWAADLRAHGGST